jgi:hypothetical protein
MIGGGDPARRAEQEIRALFAEDGALERGVDWAREMLAGAGADPVRRPVRCVRTLRRADRRLSLVAARYLVDAAAGRPARRGASGLNPHLD